ncbi:MAG: hypothetical protein HZB16_04830 [Armatimonadetes bacterium]|nr:hypothetical protein [Armatimonadota bacterium]
MRGWLARELYPRRGLLIYGVALALLTIQMAAPAARRMSTRPYLGICQNHLANLNRAMCQYAQDYDERLPDKRAWPDQIAPYVAKAEYYTCPAAPELRHVPGDPGQPGAFCLNNTHRLLDAAVPPTIGSVLETSRWVLLADGMPAAGRSDVRGRARFGNGTCEVLGYSGEPVFVARHRGQVDCGFAMGGVHGEPLSSVYPGFPPRTINPEARP